MCGMNRTPPIPDEAVEPAREAAPNATIRPDPECQAAGERLARRFSDLWRERSGNSGGWRFNRDELYEERLHPERP